MTIRIWQETNTSWRWEIEGIGFKFSGGALHYVKAASDAYQSWQVIKRQEKKMASEILGQYLNKGDKT